MGLTWTCMACGEERPDEVIDVFKSPALTDDPRLEVVRNFRHCNDRRECIEVTNAMPPLDLRSKR